MICCTNNHSRERLLEADAFTDSTLFIAQDGGYLLGPTFRSRYPSFADDVGQLTRHLHEEFPFDAHPMTLVGDLNHADFLGRGTKAASGACVYLFGIALADIVTALHMTSLRTAHTG